MARPGEYSFSEGSGRYYGPDGRFVPASQIRSDLEGAIRDQQQEVRALAERYRKREVTLREFEAVMRQQIKDVHLYSAAMARGGWAQMDDRAYGQVGGLVGREYVYLENMLLAVRSGAQPTDGFFVNRSLQYVIAGKDTYFQAERAMKAEQGKQEERNILGHVETGHCIGGNSCTEQSARGFVSIGTLVAIGRRRCLRQCQCHLVYR